MDALCGWHLDHGAITVLTSPLYHNLKGEEVSKPEDCGLYVKAVDGDVVKCDVPDDCFLVQLGEMFQYFSGGLLRATPHCVRACPSNDITRQNLALFMNLMPRQKLKLPGYSLPWKEVVGHQFSMSHIVRLGIRSSYSISAHKHLASVG